MEIAASERVSITTSGATVGCATTGFADWPLVHLVRIGSATIKFNENQRNQKK